VPDDKPPAYRLVDRSVPESGSERSDVVARLMAASASIAPRYFYDDLGCALYGAICRLPEYYPTRTEAAIFAAHRAEIAAAVGAARQLVDLGAGDGAKAQAWFPDFKPARYIAVDIAAHEIARSLARMAPDFPRIEMVGVITDFARGLDLEGVLEERSAVFFYPGSSIGNFAPPEARGFLRSIHAHCGGRPGSGLLIGVDAKKDRRLLDAAYDDALGVTAAFNRNALLHLNARFGFGFDVTRFAHRAFYNERAGRIEMHLESADEQRVRLGEEIRTFAAGERIHTENSYKYHAEEFEEMLHGAGFASVRRWSAPHDAYFVFYAA
jgi:L-histidine Nalpha-methyltransferase